MKLRNAPQRAMRKLRMDGVKPFIKEAQDLLITDMLFYRSFYWRFLQDRLSVITRRDLHRSPNTSFYEEFSGSVRIKGSPGFRDLENPVQYEPGNRFVCEVPDAVILGPAGLGLTSKGEPILDTVTPPPISQTPSRRVGVALSQSMRKNGIRKNLSAINANTSSKKEFGEVAVAIPPWNNYYHWTIGCLLRFRLLEKHGEKTGRYPDVLVPSDSPSWMQETLDILGYSGCIVKWEGGVTSAQKLVVPTFPDPIPSEVSWLKTRMKNAVTKSTTSKKIYIDRGDATIRRVKNKKELNRTLSKHDIDAFRLSNLTVKEQLELFANAEVIVAPHGAGLTNLIYSTNASIVELFGEEVVATFDRLTEMTGQDYNYLKCRQRGVDIQVDTNSLDNLLENILK